MLEVLTSGGIELAISLSSDNDHVSITLQLLEVTNVSSSSAATSTPAHVKAKLSDGKHYSGIMLSKTLH
jgi:hypothetical protein